MNATALQAAYERELVASELQMPMHLLIGDETVLASGTSAGNRFLMLEAGGQAQQKEISFVIRKSVFPRRLEMHEIVRWNGDAYMVRKVWGDEPYAAGYSYRADQWLE